MKLQTLSKAFFAMFLLGALTFIGQIVGDTLYFQYKFNDDAWGPLMFALFKLPGTPGAMLACFFAALSLVCTIAPTRKSSH